MNLFRLAIANLRNDKSLRAAGLTMELRLLQAGQIGRNFSFVKCGVCTGWSWSAVSYEYECPVTRKPQTTSAP